MGTSIMEEKKAVESGYWHLYRFNPELKRQGKNPFVLDSKEPKKSFREFIEGEIRYSSLKNVFPDIAEKLYQMAEKTAKERFERYKKLAE
jgi:pyruvate-ferredoxin/flavodoxin oxidoreductase